MMIKKQFKNSSLYKQLSSMEFHFMTDDDLTFVLHPSTQSDPLDHWQTCNDEILSPTYPLKRN